MRISRILLFFLLAVVWCFENNDAITMQLKAGKQMLKNALRRPYKAIRRVKLTEHANIPKRLITYTKNKSVGSKIRKLGPRILRIARKKVGKLLGRESPRKTKRLRRKRISKASKLKASRRNMKTTVPSLHRTSAEFHHRPMNLAVHDHYDHHHQQVRSTTSRNHKILNDITPAQHYALEYHPRDYYYYDSEDGRYSITNRPHYYYHRLNRNYPTKDNSHVSSSSHSEIGKERCCYVHRIPMTHRCNTVPTATTIAQTYPVGKWVSQYDYITGVIRNFSEDIIRSLLKVGKYASSNEATTQPYYDSIVKREETTTSTVAPKSVTTEGNVNTTSAFSLKTSINVKQMLLKAGKWRTDCENPTVINVGKKSEDEPSVETTKKHWFTERWSPRFSYHTGTWDVRESTPTPWPINPTAVWSGRYFTELYTHHYKNKTISPILVSPTDVKNNNTGDNVTTPYVTGTYSYGNATNLWSGRWFSEPWSTRFSYHTGTWDVRESTPTPWPTNPTAIWSGRYFTQFYTHHYKNMTISPFTIKPPRGRKKSTTTPPLTNYTTGTYNYGNITGLWSGRWFSEYPYPDLTTTESSVNKRAAPQWFDA